MPYTVVFTPEAEAQLVELYGYIAAEPSAEIAARFTDAIVTHCESLSTFPPWKQARRHPPWSPCHRLPKARCHAFDVDEDRANIIGVFYGGQDYESVLLE